MSREKDVEALDKQIADLEGKLKDTVTKYQDYARGVEATVKEILTDAGVWDEVKGMEDERNETREKAQKKLNEIQQSLTDKRKIRDFLVARDNIDKRQENPEAEKDEGKPVPPSFEDEPSELDKEPEAPKLSEDEGKVVDIPSEKSDDKPKKPEPPEL